MPPGHRESDGEGQRERRLPPTCFNPPLPLSQEGEKSGRVEHSTPPSSPPSVRRKSRENGKRSGRVPTRVAAWAPTPLFYAQPPPVQHAAGMPIAVGKKMGEHLHRGDRDRPGGRVERAQPVSVPGACCFCPFLHDLRRLRIIFANSLRDEPSSESGRGITLDIKGADADG